MKSLKDLLHLKADEIGQSGIRTDLDLVQKELDRLFNSSVSLLRITDGVATVTTSNASAASDMRLQTSQLIEDLNSSLKTKLTKMIIRII